MAATAPDRIVDEAFMTAYRSCCVIHQLAAHFGIPARELELEFAEAASELYGDESDGYPFNSPGNWEPSKGCTPRMVKALCEKRRMSCHGFWQDSKVLQYIAQKNQNNGSVVFSFSNEHLNLYDEEGAKSLTQWLLNQEAPHARLERLDPDAAVRDNKRAQVDLADLQAWPLFWESLTVGHLFVDSTFSFLDARVQLLRSGRCPRVLWRSLTKPRLLIYALTKKEAAGVQGDCKRLYVHNVPPECRFLQTAADKLHIPYRLEGLGTFVQRAFRACAREARAHLVARALGDFEEAGQQVQDLQCGFLR